MDKRKRHLQLFEVNGNLKVDFSAINFLVATSCRVLRMTNGFGYFCQNKSSIRAPKISFYRIRLRCNQLLNEIMGQ